MRRRAFCRALRLASFTRFFGWPAFAKRLCRAFQIGQHLIGMPIRFYVVEDVRNLAIRANYKCGARDSFHFSAIHIFFFDHAKGFADLLVGVREQGIGQVVFVLELLLRLRRVG